MFDVRIDHRADKVLERLQIKTRNRIESALHALKDDPYRPRPSADIKMLRGQRQYYRLRVGDHRVFYFVFPDEKVVVVVDVRHRGRAYD